MINIFSNRKKKYIAIFAALILLLIAAAIITPVLIENEKKNWETTLTDKIEFSASSINNAFKIKSELLVKTGIPLKQELIKILSNSAYDRKKIFDLLISNGNDKYAIQLYDDSDNLIVWNSQPFVQKYDFNFVKEMLGQTFFTGKKLLTYLSLAELIEARNTKFIFLISLPIEKHYNFVNKNFEFVNIPDSISKSLSVAINLDYSPAAGRTKDGRKYSSIILNNFNNKIGIATFDKPALETSLDKIQSQSILTQAFILILIIILFGFYSKYYFNRITSRTVRILFLTGYLALLRMVLFYFEIPSSIMQNSLTDSSNFSSVFGFGIVRSPLEFTITAIFLLVIVQRGYKYSIQYFFDNNTKGKKWYLFSAISVFSLMLYLLVYRGFAASLRSVIFDSTIRYFKDFSLLPDPPILIMCLNILILGYCSIVFSIILVILIFYYVPPVNQRSKYIFISAVFFILQISGWIFDTLQSEPQGTPLIRILFITISFLIAFYVFFRTTKQSVLHFIYFAFAATILSVSLLTYYNSEIERESLKTTAQEITRTDERLIEFMIYQTLIKVQQNEDVVNSFTEADDMSSDAFIVWTNSLLYREGLHSEISFYDSMKKRIGNFSSPIDMQKYLNNSVIKVLPDSLHIQKQLDSFTKRIIIIGTVPISDEEKIIGYASAAVVYNKDNFNFTELPKFLMPQRAGISSAINFEKLKIFDFQNNNLARSYGNVLLSESDREKLLSARFSSYNEAWINLELNNENHLIYLLKEQNTEKKNILAVAVGEKNFSWSLSDFFKIFFVHTIIIMIILLIITVVKYKMTFRILSSYKTRLVGAFLVVSLIPLILVAIYFRNLTEEKNSELVAKRLTELAQQVESYVGLYTVGSTINDAQIYEKAVNDLNISFSLYRKDELVYSSENIFYNIGLLPNTLNAIVYKQSILNSDSNVFLKERFENYSINSIYHRLAINGEDLIINVSDLFNVVAVPLSDVELDIFLFGIFSLAAIMLFIFSTLLAEQISSPIRRLTNATKSVGAGDLNVEVNYNRHGEIKDLIDGFNSMVRRIKQSQSELAQLERETAWKEMAKQVAHEIKNPLTPIRLNVQQLITAHKDKSPKFDSIFEKVTSTIISQIEILKNIASEFSNFARMPKLYISKLNTVPIIQDAVNLFTEENRQIKFITEQKEIIINADQDHLKRTIVNLVRNSIQAEADIISVTISSANNFCRVRVEDNGKGINPENIDKVFNENFTTKKSGMGIGLNIAKRFIESIGGNIAIEKTSEEGTIILITIPLAE